MRPSFPHLKIAFLSCLLLVSVILNGQIVTISSRLTAEDSLSKQIQNTIPTVITHSVEFGGNTGNLPSDTIFNRGQRIIFEEAGFFDTRTGDFPLGWAVANYSQTCASMNFLEAGRGIVSYVKELKGERALAIVDSIDAQCWDNSATLVKFGQKGNRMGLPPAFTIECNFYMVDSSSSRNGIGEFEIFFKEFLANYKNELNVRVYNSGEFEMNCDANDSSLGPNISGDVRSFYGSYVRSQGRNTQFHRELKGNCSWYSKDSWHKLAISYSNHRMRCWLDGRYLGYIESCLSPTDFSINGVAEFGINNITLAELETEVELTALITTRKLVTRAIHFELNQYEIREESIPLLEKVARWLLVNKTERLEIIGHTDSTGNQVANMELSQKRAEAVKALLHRYGVEKKRIVAKGGGSNLPISNNTTVEGRAMNRRVELRLF